MSMRFNVLVKICDKHDFCTSLAGVDLPLFLLELFRCLKQVRQLEAIQYVSENTLTTHLYALPQLCIQVPNILIYGFAVVLYITFIYSACAEFFGMRNGQEYIVSHYLFSKKE